MNTLNALSLSKYASIIKEKPSKSINKIYLENMIHRIVISTKNKDSSFGYLKEISLKK